MEKTELAAQTKAQELIAKMKYGKWEPRVWENIGWCYDIGLVTGHLRVTEHSGKYFTSLSPEFNGVGTPVSWAVEGSFNDPNDAVLAQVTKVVKIMHEMADIVAKVSHGLFSLEVNDENKR